MLLEIYEGRAGTAIYLQEVRIAGARDNGVQTLVKAYAIDGDIIRELLKADSQADIESKNKLRKQRDAASERALIYAAKLGEAEMKIHELKIRLEMMGVNYE